MDAAAPPLSQTDEDSVLPPVFDRAKRHLAERRPIVLGISPGNPYYYREENLRKLLQFANEHSDKVRDWSLIIGRGGGATKQEGGGHVKFYPYEKGGGRKKVLAMLKGGAQQVLG